MTKIIFKFLIIGDIYPPYWKDAYISSVKTAGHKADFLDVSDIRIDLNNGTLSVFNLGESITKYTHIIFLSEVYEKLYFYLCYILRNSDIKILNSKSILKYPYLSDKFLQSIILNENQIDTPKTSYSLNPLLINDVYNYPLIVKTLGASHSSHSGRGVIKVFTKKHLEYIYSTNVEGGLKSQEFIEISPVHDYRTTILNGKSLGTIKKIPVEGEYRANAAPMVIDIPDNPNHVKKLVNLSKKLSCDFLAPDYIIKDGKMIIFELNRFPSFHKSHLHLTHTIVDFMLRKK